MVDLKIPNCRSSTLDILSLLKANPFLILHIYVKFFYFIFFLVPNTAAQTGGNNGGSGGTTDPAILLELQYLRNNLTALKNDVANTPKVKHHV